jgi:predicted RNase H-like HicB family nuclease
LQPKCFRFPVSAIWFTLPAVKTLFDYQVVCRRDDNGSFVAYVPALDGCHAIGTTPEEAQRELQNVFDMIAEEFAESGRELPNDVQLSIVNAS